MACNFLMDEWFTDSLGLPMVDENRAWLYKAADGSEQVDFEFGFKCIFLKQKLFIIY